MGDTIAAYAKENELRDMRNLQKVRRQERSVRLTGERIQRRAVHTFAAMLEGARKLRPVGYYEDDLLNAISRLSEVKQLWRGCMPSKHRFSDKHGKLLAMPSKAVSWLSLHNAASVLVLVISKRIIIVATRSSIG